MKKMFRSTAISIAAIVAGVVGGSMVLAAGDPLRMTSQHVKVIIGGY